MENRQEIRTPHSDITSFLILSNNHYTRSNEKICFKEEKIYKKPILKGLAKLIEVSPVRISKTNSSYDNGICFNSYYAFQIGKFASLNKMILRANLVDKQTYVAEYTALIEDDQRNIHEDFLYRGSGFGLISEFETLRIPTYGGFIHDANQRQEYENKCKLEFTIYPLEISIGPHKTLAITYTVDDNTKKSLFRAYNGLSDTKSSLPLACVYPHLRLSSPIMFGLQREIANQIAEVILLMAHTHQEELRGLTDSHLDNLPDHLVEHHKLHVDIIQIISDFFNRFASARLEKYASKRSRRRSLRDKAMYRMIQNLKELLIDVNKLQDWAQSDTDRLRNLVVIKRL
jgi:hypothetical protein